MMVAAVSRADSGTTLYSEQAVSRLMAVCRSHMAGAVCFHHCAGLQHEISETWSENQGCEGSDVV
jgi:succinate dehydrogenase/fumarate reductase cytochrome b subunit